MPANPFSTPSSGGRLTEYMGRLIIVTPREYRDSFQTSIGETEVIFADVVVLDEKDPVKKSEELTNLVIFGKVLVPELRRILEDERPPALGRLGKRKSKTAGKNDAHALIAAEPGEIAIAMKYWESRTANPFSSVASDSEDE
jgi:hypothetical protein